MQEYRVIYVEDGSDKKCLKRWPTEAEARAFIVGLRRGKAVKVVQLLIAEDGHKPVLLPLRVTAETSATVQ